MPSLVIHSRINDRELRRALRQLERAGGDMQAMFADAGEYLIRSTEARFAAQVGPDGRPWQEVKPQTRARKKHPKILTESHRLRDSIVYRAGPTQLAIGSNVAYAAIHQFGGRTRPHPIRPKRKKALFWSGAAHPVRVVQHPGSDIPARPYLGLSADDRAELLAILGDHLADALR